MWLDERHLDPNPSQAPPVWQDPPQNIRLALCSRVLAVYSKHLEIIFVFHKKKESDPDEASMWPDTGYTYAPAPSIFLFHPSIPVIL
jgi:hypothetical protein